MESMRSYYTQDDAPWCPYQTTPVTMGKFITALNQIEVEHQKNAEFFKNLNSVIWLDEFHKQVTAAQKVAEDVSIQENRGVPLPHNDLAHQQEVIFYATSCLGCNTGCTTGDFVTYCTHTCIHCTHLHTIPVGTGFIHRFLVNTVVEAPWVFTVVIYYIFICI